MVFFNISAVFGKNSSQPTKTHDQKVITKLTTYHDSFPPDTVGIKYENGYKIFLNEPNPRLYLHGEDLNKDLFYVYCELGIHPSLAEKIVDIYERALLRTKPKTSLLKKLKDAGIEYFHPKTRKISVRVGNNLNVTSITSELTDQYTNLGTLLTVTDMMRNACNLGFRYYFDQLEQAVDDVN